LRQRNLASGAAISDWNRSLCFVQGSGSSIRGSIGDGFSLERRGAGSIRPGTRSGNVVASVTGRGGCTPGPNEALPATLVLRDVIGVSFESRCPATGPAAPEQEKDSRVTLYQALGEVGGASPGTKPPSERERAARQLRSRAPLDYRRASGKRSGAWISRSLLQRTKV